MNFNFRFSTEKKLQSTLKKVPIEFKWLIYAGLWEGIKIPLPRLIKNRKAFQVYKEFTKRFPSSINAKYELALNSPCSKKDLEKLKNIVSKRDAITYQALLTQADTLDLERKKNIIKQLRETSRQVLLEELQITEKITDQELKEIIEGKHDKKIAKELSK